MGFRTPNRCEQAARHKIAVDPETAFLHLQACSQRSDFDVLEPLVRDPWSTALRSHGLDGLVVLVRSMARRAELDRDLGSVRMAGFKVYSIDEKHPPVTLVGRVVLLSGVVNRTGPLIEMAQLGYEKPKYLTYVRPSYTVTTRYQYDGWGRVNAVRRTLSVAGDASISQRKMSFTGRIFRFAGRPSCDPGKDRVVAMLARVNRVSPGPDGEDQGVVDISAIYCRLLGK